MSKVTSTKGDATNAQRGVSESSQSVISSGDYDRFCRFLECACGITLGANKSYLVRSRLNTLVQRSYNGSFSDLVLAMEQGSAAGDRARVIDAMTTNETLWFRDAHPFVVLKEHLLPELCKDRRKPLRIWSAACSSGQEPYSISMIISEFLAGRPGSFPASVEIVATDISPTVLTYAKQGCYDELEVARGLSIERQQRFFSQDGANLRVREEISRRVKFKEANLLNSFSGLGQFDIVFCRNVLIYFSNDNKKQILSRIARQLSPRGYLFLGGSEPLANYSEEFEMLRLDRSVLYRLK